MGKVNTKFTIVIIVGGMEEHKLEAEETMNEDKIIWVAGT